MPRLPIVVWLAIGASVAMVIGSFAPWAKAVGLLNASIGGTDGANDGWIVVGAAAVGALCSLWYSRGARVAALGIVAAGIAGSAVTIYDRGNLTDAANDSTSNLVSLQVGWGLNLAMGASVVLAIIGFIALVGNQDAPGMKVAPAEAPTDPDLAVVAPTGVAAASSAPPSRSEAGSTADELERLANLQARGMLTDEEFQAAKQRLLDL